MATKERLAAMAASLCSRCSGAMLLHRAAPDPRDGALELRTYDCAECGHRMTYSVSGDHTS
jgi:DNA-directed RNA polymerase subunit RPC12/RpoP